MTWSTVMLLASLGFAGWSIILYRSGDSAWKLSVGAGLMACGPAILGSFRSRAGALSALLLTSVAMGLLYSFMNEIDRERIIARILIALAMLYAGISLARYSETDDAPGGVVIGFGIALIAVALGIRALLKRSEARKHREGRP